MIIWDSGFPQKQDTGLKVELLQSLGTMVTARLQQQHVPLRTSVFMSER